MALLALPPPKAEPFPFSPLHYHKPNSPTILQKHQDSGHYTTNIRNQQHCLRYGAISRKARNLKTAFAIVRAAASIPVQPGYENGSSFGRILPSDVMLKRRRNVYWDRKWNYWDVPRAGMVLAVHILCIFAPFTFNWGAFWVAVGLYVISGLLGITLCYHRNLSHKSLKLPKWLEYFFACCAVQAIQFSFVYHNGVPSDHLFKLSRPEGDPIEWVSTHRYHHQFCDTEKDPHSPLEGFWFGHVNWIFDTDAIVDKCGKPNNVGDLEKQPFYKFLQRTQLIHLMALGALLYAVGGFPYVVWGMGVRVVWAYHVTWFVNSACHTWGKQTWNTNDLSQNNWWVALVTFGEGWHNNHHAFEYSPRHGLEWWQIDITWYAIRFLEAIGLATEVKLPTEAQKQRLALVK